MLSYMIHTHVHIDIYFFYCAYKKMKRRRTDPTFTGTRNVCLLSPDPRGFCGVTRRNSRQSAEFCFERTVTMFHMTSQHVEVFPAKELLLCSACVFPPAVRHGVQSFKSSSLYPPEENQAGCCSSLGRSAQTQTGPQVGGAPWGFCFANLFLSSIPDFSFFGVSWRPGDGGGGGGGVNNDLSPPRCFL